MIIFVIGEAGFALSVFFIVKSLIGKLRIIFDKQLIKTIFVFSLPIGLGSVIGTIRTELDKLIIAGFYNTEQMAVYTNSAREMPVTIIASSLTAVLLPQLVRLLKKDKNDKAIHLWGDVTTLSYTIICFLAIGIFAFAPDVITLLYSEKYISGVPVFRIYSLVLLFRCTYFGMILNATGHTKLILKSTTVTLILDVVFNFVLYYILGFIGPALSTLIATAVSATYQLILTSRILKISFKNIFPWKNIIIITSANIILGVLFVLLKKILPWDITLGGIMESIVLAIIWAMIYFVFTLKLIKNKWHEINKDNETVIENS
jgi:O-antigen/teichoic acid export membrane protein